MVDRREPVKINVGVLCLPHPTITQPMLRVHPSEPQSSGAVSALDGHSAQLRLEKVNFKITFHCTTLVKMVQRSIRTAINYFLLYPLQTK